MIKNKYLLHQNYNTHNAEWLLSQSFYCSIFYCISITQKMFYLVNVESILDALDATGQFRNKVIHK